MKRKIKLLALVIAVITAITAVGCSKNVDLSSRQPTDKTQTEQPTDSNQNAESNESIEIGENIEISENNSNSSLSALNKADDKDSSKDDGSPNSDKYKNSNRLKLFDNGGFFAYKIVYDDMITENDKNQIMKTWRIANRASSGTIKIYDDEDGNVKGKTTGLLLYGDLDYAAVKTAQTTLRNDKNFAYNDYIILVVNGNIIIYSYTEEGRSKAVSFFNQNILQNNESLTIPDDYCYIYNSTEDTGFTIDSVDVSKYVIVMEKYPSLALTAGADEIIANIKEKTGYELSVIKTNENIDYKYKIKFSLSGSDNKYSLSIDNGTVNIVAGKTYSLNAAIHRFAANIANTPDNKKINIPKSFAINGTYNSDTKNTDGYHLVFADEFSGSELNKKYWKPLDYSIATQGAGGGRYSFNVSTKDGLLNLATSAEQKEDGMYYYGSGVNSLFTYQFGYIEIRAKINEGTGIWPGFWLYTDMTPTKQFHPEIDIFEFFGSDKKCVSQLHSWWPAGSSVIGQQATDTQNAAGHIEHLTEEKGNTYTLPGNTSFSKDFHTYGCEWTPQYIKFSCDGYVYCTVNIQSELRDSYGAPLNEYMMFLNSGGMRASFWSNLGDAQFGKIDENTVIPNCYYVDYIHLYQQLGVGYINLP